MPSINALYEDFKGRGFAVLLLNMGESPGLVRRTVKARGYTAPVLLDPERQVTTAYLVTATPTVYLVDRRSHIIGRAVGRRDWAGETGRQLITALLRP